MTEHIKHNGEHVANQTELRSTSESRRPGVEVESPLEKHRELLESARKTAEKESVSSEQIKVASQPDAPMRITKRDKIQAYKQTMGLVQAGLSKPSRSFSRLIHQPAVAKISEAAEKSVARPGAVLGAGLSAVIGLSVMLFFARRYGFSLSGSEFIVLLLAGWLIGLGIDLVNSRFKRI